MRVHPGITAAILIGLGLLAAEPAASQATADLEWVEVSIWPEYDRPSALIIVNAQLADDVSIPTTVSLPLPGGLTPHAVAKATPENRLLLAEYTVEEGESSSFVRIKTDLRVVRLEYYTDLSVVDSERELIWIWPGGSAVGKLRYDVLPPPGATNLAIDPPAIAQRADGAGMTHLAADLGPQSASDRLALRLTYTKPTAELTVQALERMQAAASPGPSGSAPRPAEVPPAEEQRSVWPFVLPILAIALIVAWSAFRRRSR